VGGGARCGCKCHHVETSGVLASGRRCGLPMLPPSTSPSQPKSHCRSRRRHGATSSLMSPLRLKSRSAGRPALWRCDVTNDWGVLCDSDPLTVARSTRGADSARGVVSLSNTQLQTLGHSCASMQEQLSKRHWRMGSSIVSPYSRPRRALDDTSLSRALGKK
jgi:hypothetical protein